MIAAWADLAGEKIIIGDENVAKGEPVLVIPLTQECIIEWIRVLLDMLEDGEIRDLPGEMGKCTTDA